MKYIFILNSFTLKNDIDKIKKKIAQTYEKIHNILDYHFYKIAQQLTEKISSNLYGNTKHQRHVKKQQTIP